MAVSQWKSISWGPNPEPLDIDKLNDISTDLQYLYDRTPSLNFKNWKAQGLKIACGVSTVPPVGAYTTTVQTYFGSFFTPGCRPVITLSIQSPQNRRLSTTFYGLDGPSSTPDHRGFIGAIDALEFNSKASYIQKTLQLHWIAMGY